MELILIAVFSAVIGRNGISWWVPGLIVLGAVIIMAVHLNTAADTMGFYSLVDFVEKATTWYSWGMVAALGLTAAMTADIHD